MLAMAASDMLENATVAGLALGHAGAPSPPAWLAGSFTLAKIILITATASATGTGPWKTGRGLAWKARKGGFGKIASGRRVGRWARCGGA